MDVLEYFDPPIDWSRFSQGELSDNIWSNFLDLVRLCHAYKHWKNAVSSHIKSRPPESLYTQSRYQKNKVLNEHRADRNKLKGYMNRSAFLAAGKVGAILPKEGDAVDSLDYKLALVIPHAVGISIITDTMRGHEKSNFEVLALNEFDADILEKEDEKVIAEYWRSHSIISD